MGKIREGYKFTMVSPGLDVLAHMRPCRRKVQPMNAFFRCQETKCDNRFRTLLVITRYDAVRGDYVCVGEDFVMRNIEEMFAFKIEKGDPSGYRIIRLGRTSFILDNKNELPSMRVNMSVRPPDRHRASARAQQ